MELIILPGNSIYINDWAKGVQTSLQDLFDPTYVLDYLHWESGKDLISLDAELPRLVSYIDARDNYAIFAISAGVVLALKAAQERKIRPKFCVFVGTPAVAAEELNLEINRFVKDYQFPTLFIQNDEDPTGSIAELTELLVENNVKNYELVTLSGATHDYDDIGLLREKVMAFSAHN